MSAGKVETLGDAFPLEIERVEELLQGYKKIGQIGRFAVHNLTDLLRRARAALAAGDTVAMLSLYKEMGRALWSVG